jgi:hypothetical protein
MRILTCVLLLVAACNWSNRQRVMAAATVAVLAIDWHQTHEVVRMCDETNPIIGECGDSVPVNVYFPLAIATVLVLADRLPKWREPLLGTVFGVQLATVRYNQVLGY